MNQAITGLLAQAGITGDAVVEAIPGGANNQVFRVNVGEQHFLLKKYFQHPEDPRQRLLHERHFLTFAWDQGLRCIPKPLAWDEQAGLGLSQFVVGHPPTTVTSGHVHQALAFVKQLNLNRQDPTAQAIPSASERCYRLWDHVVHVERRLDKLRHLSAITELHQNALSFAQNQLIPHWERIILAMRQHSHFDRLNEPLTEQAHCLSPSDFGFHNSLLTATDHLIFVDFEYAGWDDPAQLVCDFFCQVARPAPTQSFQIFATTFAQQFPQPEHQLERMHTLLPVHQVKWICIVLNHFLRVGQERREFAAQNMVAEAKLQHQLQLAQTLFKHLTGAS